VAGCERGALWLLGCLAYSLFFRHRAEKVDVAAPKADEVVVEMRFAPINPAGKCV
jgi:hypothetical protein